MADNLTPPQRSFCMSRIKGKDTGLEKLVCRELRSRGLRFGRYDGTLPGRPDIVFRKAKVAVFIDGDFWHGYRFPLWRSDVSRFWRTKIGRNRIRDQRNFKKLRRMGWKVVRIWQHQLTCNATVYYERIVNLVGADAIGSGSRLTRNGRWPS